MLPCRSVFLSCVLCCRTEIVERALTQYCTSVPSCWLTIVLTVTHILTDVLCGPYNLYCVGGDVKPCSINQSINLYGAAQCCAATVLRSIALHSTALCSTMMCCAMLFCAKLCVHRLCSQNVLCTHTCMVCRCCMITRPSCRLLLLQPVKPYLMRSLPRLHRWVSTWIQSAPLCTISTPMLTKQSASFYSERAAYQPTGISRTSQSQLTVE